MRNVRGNIVEGRAQRNGWMDDLLRKELSRVGAMKRASAKEAAVAPIGPVERELAEKVAFLRVAAHYPNRPPDVTVRETHMSWVFLAGDYVFKLKKPVRNRLLDFSTVEAREFNSHEEVRLNRRLSPQVYMGVAPLTRLPNGELSFLADGCIVDWLVKMRRLPAEQMLDVVLTRQLVRPNELDALADLLASFYRRAERPVLEAEDYIAQFLREQQLNREIIAGRAFGIDRVRADRVLADLDHCLQRCRPLLSARVKGGAIVEGHGDLRPEHICLADPIAIFDCLEFNRDLRLVDVADELAFLEVECSLLGAPSFGQALMAKVCSLLDERPPDEILRLYRMFRATLRARLCLAHLLDGTTRERTKWEPLADRYLEFAESIGSHGRA